MILTFQNVFALEKKLLKHYTLERLLEKGRRLEIII